MNAELHWDKKGALPEGRMSGWITVMVLILTTAALFVLPMVPALRELFSSDSQPLEVAEGTVVFGSLWAREFGLVVAR